MEVCLLNFARSKGPTRRAVTLLNKLPHLWSKFDKLGIFGIRRVELCIEFSISSLKDGFEILTLCSASPKYILVRFSKNPLWAFSNTKRHVIKMFVQKSKPDCRTMLCKMLDFRRLGIFMLTSLHARKILITSAEELIKTTI